MSISYGDLIKLKDFQSLRDAVNTLMQKRKFGRRPLNGQSASITYITKPDYRDANSVYNPYQYMNSSDGKYSDIFVQGTLITGSPFSQEESDVTKYSDYNVYNNNYQYSGYPANYDPIPSTQSREVGCGGECAGLCITICANGCKLGCSGSCGDSCSGSCSSACVGRCSGCTGCQNSCDTACVYTCMGCTGSCTNGCGSLCWSQCDSDCGVGCDLDCNSSCDVACGYDCDKTCRGTCDGRATSACDCGGNCGEDCGNLCNDFCSGRCAGCSGTCKQYCFQGCKGTNWSSYCSGACYAICGSSCETECSAGCVQLCSGCGNNCESNCGGECRSGCQGNLMQSAWEASSVEYSNIEVIATDSKIFEVPENVTKVCIMAVGGGGGSRGSYQRFEADYEDWYTCYGSGGGGGGYTNQLTDYSVKPHDKITVQIGEGGAGGIATYWIPDGKQGQFADTIGGDGWPTKVFLNGDIKNPILVASGGKRGGIYYNSDGSEGYSFMNGGYGGSGGGAANDRIDNPGKSYYPGLTNHGGDNGDQGKNHYNVQNHGKSQTQYLPPNVQSDKKITTFKYNGVSYGSGGGGGGSYTWVNFDDSHAYWGYPGGTSMSGGGHGQNGWGQELSAGKDGTGGGGGGVRSWWSQFLGLVNGKKGGTGVVIIAY